MKTTGRPFHTLFLLFFLSFLLFPFFFAQIADGQDNQGALQELKTSYRENLELLQKQYELQNKSLEQNYRQRIKDLEQKYESAVRELKRDNEKLAALLDARVTKTENQADFLSRYIGPVTVTGIILTLAVLFFKIREIARPVAESIFNREYRKKFEEMFSEKEEKIRQIVKDYDDVTRLKKTKSLLILSHGASDTSFLKRFFHTQGFEKYRFLPFDSGVSHAGYDMVFFNNEDEKMNANEIISYAQGLPKDKMFFYFGRVQIKDSELKKNFASANFRSQLYGNIVNALRLTESFIDEQKSEE